MKTNFETIAKACQEHFSQYQISAIYLAGSQMRGTARPDSDYDLIVIVDPTIEGTLLYRQLVSQQSTFTKNGIDYDCKLYEKAKLYELMLKCGPQIIEVLQYLPIYYQQTDQPLIKFIYQHRQELFLLNPIKSFKSGKGIIMNVLDSMHKEHDNIEKVAKYQVLIDSELALLAKFLNTTVNSQQDVASTLAEWETNLLPQYQMNEKLRQELRQIFIDNLLHTLKITAKE